MNKNFKHSLLLVLVLLTTTACNLPAADATDEPALTSTPTLTPEAATNEPATEAAAGCEPTIKTNTDANVRSGPGLAYGIYGVIPQNGTAPVAGKNSAGDWWYIEFAGGEGGHGWIAGSITTATCIPETLAIITAPPVPVAQESPNTNTNDSNSNNQDAGDNNDNGGGAPPTFEPIDPIIIVGILPQLPANPSNINVSKKCDQIGNFPFFQYNQTNTITWKDNSNNETGFKVYRFGTLITTTGQNVQKFVDILYNQSPGTPNSYSVAATNAVGDSDKISLTISGCN